MINRPRSLRTILALLIVVMTVTIGVGAPILAHAAKNPINQVTGASSQKKVRIRQVNFLKSYVKRYPNNAQGWEALAKTQENAGQITQAIATWQYIGEHFNRMSEAVAHQAKLLWKNGQPKKAFSLLLSNQDNATEKDSSFWEILGELSWELKQTEHSLAAYSILLKSGNNNALVAERLIQLTRDMGKAEESIAIGEEVYHRLNQPRWLLLSMDVANQAGLSTQLKRLLKMAISNESQFQDLEMYWLMRAQLEIHENKPKIATQHYQQALKVNPASTTAKEGILWNLIEQNDKRSLQSYIKIWRLEASENSLLWGVYGIALTKVGQNKEALPWLERKSRISPDDYLWQLTYADALSRSGHADAAWQRRKYALFNLRSRFNKIGNEPDKKIKDLLHPVYLALIRDMEGADAEVSILKKLLAKGYDEPVVQELLVAAYLSQKNYFAARHWLLQDHIARQNSPAWQRLALALAENDLVAAERILENENNKLTEFNKMETLKRLDRNEEALALTYDLLESHKEQPALQTYLFQSRDELAVKLSKQIIGGFDYKSLGDINFTESRARISSPYLRGALAMELKHTLLDSSRPDLILPANNEVDIMTEFRHPLRQGMFQANLGGNLREDKSLAYGTFRVSQDITDKLKANLRLSVNEMSTETAALRALGAKDTILLGLSTQLTQQAFFNLEIDGHHYSTRERSTLGNGYKLQSILGTSLLTTGNQNWQIRLQGAWESNHLASTLPSELNGLLGASREEVLTLIPKSFGTMGMGTVFRYGGSDQGVLRRPFLLTDVWAGWVWPTNAMGYNGRISVGIPLLGPDILSAGAFYSNIQGGRTDQAFTGVGLQYSIRF